MNGPLIRPIARRLLGVDLSEGMIEEARKKAVYDELRVGDMTQVLAEYDSVFDLALCTDVMVYLGSLTPVFAAARRALKAGALFAFTTEIHSGEGFVVGPARRYLHARDYVETEAMAQGFALLSVESFTGRYQYHAPVVLNLFVAKRLEQH